MNPLLFNHLSFQLLYIYIIVKHTSPLLYTHNLKQEIRPTSLFSHGGNTLTLNKIIDHLQTRE